MLFFKFVSDIARDFNFPKIKFYTFLKQFKIKFFQNHIR